MSYLFMIAPVVGWLASGTIKFIINYARYQKDAFRHIGNGGFPSTHTTVVMTTVMMIGFLSGFNSAAFGLGVAFLTITIIDATGIRRALGKHAEHINKHIIKPQEGKALREKQGHNRIEVLGGIILGTIVGYILNLIAGVLNI